MELLIRWNPYIISAFKIRIDSFDSLSNRVIICSDICLSYELYNHISTALTTILADSPLFIRQPRNESCESTQVYYNSSPSFVSWNSFSIQSKSSSIRSWNNPSERIQKKSPIIFAWWWSFAHRTRLIYRQTFFSFTSRRHSMRPTVVDGKSN